MDNIIDGRQDQNRVFNLYEFNKYLRESAKEKTRKIFKRIAIMYNMFDLEEIDKVKFETICIRIDALIQDFDEIIKQHEEMIGGRANNLIFTSLLSDYRAWNDKCIALNYEIDTICNKYLNKQRKHSIIEEIGSALVKKIGLIRK